MSRANVTFGMLLSTDETIPGKEQTFSFDCPRHKGWRCEDLVIKGRTELKHDPQGKNGGIAQWDLVPLSTRQAPTFTPSIDCGCGWHGYIVNGECVNQQRQPEPEPTR